MRLQVSIEMLLERVMQRIGFLREATRQQKLLLEVSAAHKGPVLPLLAAPLACLCPFFILTAPDSSPHCLVLLINQAAHSPNLQRGLIAAASLSLHSVLNLLLHFPSRCVCSHLRRLLATNDERPHQARRGQWWCPDCRPPYCASR